LFFVLSQGKQLPWLTKALPFLLEQKESTVFMAASHEMNADWKGLNCRFGMKGVAAATHYDGGRNSVAMLRGRKR
jgi:hypothetical protein